VAVAELGHMQVCISLQTDNHASTPPLSFFTGWMPFLPPNQQHQSTEGIVLLSSCCINRNQKPHRCCLFANNVEFIVHVL